MLYLDALELAGTKEERPYFYKTQVEKIKAIRSLMTENLTEHYTLDDLAKRFDIPHTTMKSCFKSITEILFCIYARVSYELCREFAARTE